MSRSTGEGRTENKALHGTDVVFQNLATTVVHLVQKLIMWKRPGKKKLSQTQRSEQFSVYFTSQETSVLRSATYTHSRAYSLH